ncbi:MAG: sigma-54-dependent Fis family transcriptional regulator [Desulfarculus sp.]|nr:sigma-54-dependent Fis family transcriptional regulator [Desulfarculus sp.]
MEINPTNHLLLADPDHELRSQMVAMMSQEGNRVAQAADSYLALELLANNVFQLVVTDLDLPSSGGLEVLRYVQEHAPSTPVIIVSRPGSVEDAVEAMRRGAFDYQVKPLNLEHLRLTVRRALEKASLQHAYHYLRHEQPYLYRLESLTAQSEAMQQVIRQIKRLAPTNLTVMITGETGTGKSLIAGAIHANSPRRDGTMVTVNCAALSETLLESELFGHEKGAFTGAHMARAGRFQQAHGGTLFLDEVGEMSPAIQAKVLRAIEDQVIYRLGGSREIHVDVRIMAATNRDLTQAVESGLFRKDLYYRLNVATLDLAPLRQRQADILPMAEMFLQRICHELKRPLVGLSPQARRALLDYPWPGNIRELRNVIERAVLFTEGDQLTLGDLNLTMPGPEATSPACQGAAGAFLAQGFNLEDLERQAIEAALERANWVQKDAAALLGISPSRMTYKLNKLNLSHPRFRAKSRRA